MAHEGVTRLGRALKTSPPGMLGISVLAVLLLMAVLAPATAPYGPRERVGRPFQPPGSRHLLGTNDVGQDILSEVIWGARVSLTIGIVAALAATSVGTVAGCAAGYFGGLVDGVLMRTVDLVLVVPFVPLMILLAAYLGPSLYNLVFVIAGLMWARPARVVRSQVLSLRTRLYVEAAKAAGGSAPHMIRRHIVPGVLPLVLAEFVVCASLAMLIEASLSFLGLGDPLQKSWGTTLYYARVRGAFLTGAWVWWVLPPGLLITLTVLGFALTGFTLEAHCGPRLARRGAGR